MRNRNIIGTKEAFTSRALTLNNKVKGDNTLRLGTFNGSFPANISAASAAITFNITTAPSGGTVSNSQRGLQINLNDGGSGTTQATTGIVVANNTVNGTYNIQTGGANGGRFIAAANANFGVGSFGQVNGAPTIGFGSYGLVQGGTTAIGNAGFVQGGTTRIGGWFSLNTNSGPTLPTNSTALIADNAAQAARIFAAKDNGSDIFIIDDGGNYKYDRTITSAGTTGAQTINKAVGTVNFAAAATSLVVTNSLVDTSSIIFGIVRTNDTTMKSVQIVAGSGSFTIYPNAAPTDETSVGFFVTN